MKELPGGIFDPNRSTEGRTLYAAGVRVSLDKKRGADPLLKIEKNQSLEPKKSSLAEAVSRLKEAFKKEPPAEKVERDPVADIKKEAENIFSNTFGQNNKLEGEKAEEILAVIEKSFSEFAKNKTTASPEEVQAKDSRGEHKKLGSVTCNGKVVDFWLHISRYPDGRLDVKVDVDKLSPVFKKR